MKAGLSQSIDTLKHRVPVFMLKHLHCYSFHRKAVEGILGRCRCVGKRELPVSATCPAITGEVPEQQLPKSASAITPSY